MDTYRVLPNTKINFAEWDPDDTQLFTGQKEDAEGVLKEITSALERLQELLFAEHKHKILIVLQAMDTGGKDGVIRHVFDGVNPQGVRVANFKVPTPIELDHDYLWRIHQQTPGKGEIVIFNRSHYEDVLVVRVHNLVPGEVWSKRYEHITAFERTLADEGTIILKFFLNISKEEQKKRLIERRDDPNKQWKFNPGDLEERKLWEQYMKAYEDVLSCTSTNWAPWYIVPANRKWYRNLVIGKVLVNALQSLDMKYPTPKEDYSQIQIA